MRIRGATVGRKNRICGPGTRNRAYRHREVVVGDAIITGESSVVGRYVRNIVQGQRSTRDEMINDHSDARERTAGIIDKNIRPGLKRPGDHSGRSNKSASRYDRSEE